MLKVEFAMHSTVLLARVKRKRQKKKETKKRLQNTLGVLESG